MGTGEGVFNAPISFLKPSSTSSLDQTIPGLAVDPNPDIKTNLELESLSPPSPSALAHDSLTSMDAVLDTGKEDLDTIRPSDYSGPTERELNVELDEFMNACQRGNLEKVQSLISSDTVKANDCFSDGVTGLHWACINNHLAVVKYLCENENSLANPNILGGDLKATPLHWACRQSLVYVVDYLLTNTAADPTIRDAQSYNTLHLAVHTTNPIMVIYILVACVSQKSKKQIYVDEPDQSSRTALHWAAYQGDAVLINALLSFGADVSKVDNTLFIPLHWGFMVNNKQALKALLEAGSDIHVKNSSNKNSFDIAADMNCLGSWHKILSQDDRSPSLNWEKRVRWVSPRTGKIATFFVPYVLLPVLFSTCSFAQGYWPLRILAAAAEIAITVKLTERCILPTYIIQDGALAKSPFLAGIFTATAFWGVVLWLFCILPQTIWSRFFGNVTMAIVVVIFSWLYFKTLFINPGNVPTPCDEAIRISQVRDLISAHQFDSSHFCVHTLVRKPLRSKFSRTTKNLVARFDHYCPWVYNDIGVRNHKIFMAFAYTLAIAIILFVSLSRKYFDKLEDGYESSDEFLCALLDDEFCYAYYHHGFHFNYIIFCAFQMLWLSFLCLTQTFQICKGVTTYEFSKLGHSSSASSGEGHVHKSEGKVCLAMLGIDQLILTIKVAAYSVASKFAPGSSFSAAHLYESFGSLHIPSDFGIRQNVLDFWVLGDATIRNIFYLPIEGENNLNGKIVDYYKLYEWPLDSDRQV